MEPESDNELEPWERPGALRRDCEPHRGELHVRLADCTFILALASIHCFPTIPLALSLALVVSRMASRDLDRMAAVPLDRPGEHLTRKALESAASALKLCAFGIGFWLIIVLIQLVGLWK
ncbi:MAG: hypothetical protein JNM56_05450 [Planctomycetia bacterium]|nr:hypothetical protein [Planctomycetia bacterium]